MWLINTTTLALKHFIEPPPYAILSHQWVKDEDEVTFQQMSSEALRTSPAVRNKSGFEKIKNCCAQAQRDGFDYAWVDTCCINKESSAELSEAINSMYNWYGRADICYAYLRDITKADDTTNIMKSAWFTRGWTLQELIAPSNICFYDAFWNFVDTKLALASEIAEQTNIDADLLDGITKPRSYNIAEKMRWTLQRRTTRIEDQAYCLMGIFDVNMPLLYGEGQRAFTRLQEEIIRQDDDHSIFTWSLDVPSTGLLAPNPSLFITNVDRQPSSKGSRHFQMTNRGLWIKLPIQPWTIDVYIAWLNCTSRYSEKRLGVFLQRLDENDQYVRVIIDGESLVEDHEGPCNPQEDPSREVDLYVRQGIYNYSLPRTTYGFKLGRSNLFSTNNLLLDADLEYQHEVTSNADRILYNDKGSCGTVFVAQWHTHSFLEAAMFGFDFDFNPVCILAPHAYYGILDSRLCLSDDWDIETHDYRKPPVRMIRDNTKWFKLKGHHFYGLSFSFGLPNLPNRHMKFDRYEVDISLIESGDQRIWQCSIHGKENS